MTLQNQTHDPSSSSPQEIAIIGGGLIGVSTAYYLSKNPNLHKESKITLVEEENVGKGSSGCSSGFLGDSDDEGLSKDSFQLHQKLAKEHGGELKWGYKSTGLYKANISPSDPTTNGHSFSTNPSPIPFLPSASIQPTQSQAAICQPSNFIRHLCSLFLTHPGASLLIAKASSLTLSEPSSSSSTFTSTSSTSSTSSSSRVDGGGGIISNLISNIIPTSNSTDQIEENMTKEGNKIKEGRRRVNGINVIQIINGLEEIIHLKADLVVLATGIKLPSLIKSFLGRSIEIIEEIGTRNWETVVLKPKERLNPCVVTLNGGSIEGEWDREKAEGGEEEREGETEIVVRDDGKVVFSRPLPSSSPSSPSPSSTFLEHIESLSPKFKSSSGTLLLSQNYWVSPSTPGDKPLFGELSDKQRDLNVDGIWFGIGGNTTQGPAIGSKLASSILSS